MSSTPAAAPSPMSAAGPRLVNQQIDETEEERKRRLQGQSGLTGSTIIQSTGTGAQRGSLGGGATLLGGAV